MIKKWKARRAEQREVHVRLLRAEWHMTLIEDDVDIGNPDEIRKSLVRFIKTHNVHKKDALAMLEQGETK